MSLTPSTAVAVLALVAVVEAVIKPDPYPWLEGTFQLNGSAFSYRYDGHGALSAGAYSRLVYDYPEPQRGEILNYLFKPNFGASLHLLKVEIGGDSQTAYGTEPSHMHSRNDRSCKRGYELWLLKEARKRNPDIVLYALTWAVPGWVGERAWDDGFYSDDGINYLLSWLTCCQELKIGNIDVLGHRNERQWGPSAWTSRLRKALDEAGFKKTRLAIPDGSYDPSILSLSAADPTFAAAFHGGVVGLHYPCFEERPEVRLAGFDYWSTEDAAVEGDWRGAGCLGRLVNNNFVGNNMTSTITRSLLWSVYSGLRGNSTGLIDAFEPWSASYDVRETVWVLAHTTQFTKVGWRMLGTYEPAGPLLGFKRTQGLRGSSGLLSRGGSYVTYVSQTRRRTREFTVVIEKLHGVCPHCSRRGACPRCAAQETHPEELTFLLRDSLPGKGLLSFWKSNVTHKFVRLPDIIIDEEKRSFRFIAQPDSIYTVSTTRGQRHGHTTTVLSNAAETDVTTTTSTTTTAPWTTTTTTTTTTWTTTSTTSFVHEAEFELPAVEYGDDPENLQKSSVYFEPKNPFGIFAVAGVLYPRMLIYAMKNLGDERELVRLKLLPYDSSSTTMRCVLEDSHAGSPLDGSRNVVTFKIGVYQIINELANVVFPQAGKWKMCYSGDGDRWEELVPSISVTGASNINTKVWCVLTLLKRAECIDDPSILGCECMAKVDSLKQDNPTRSLLPTGIDNPAFPKWLLTISDNLGSCGNSQAVPFNYKASFVENRDDYEVHNFGVARTDTMLGVWTLCYCPGFDYDNGKATGGILQPCEQDTPEDFPQVLGRLITIDVVPWHATHDKAITVYPTLEFRLRITCGSNGISGVGGCEDTMDTRYKVIHNSATGDLPYFEVEAACRNMEQAEKQILGSKIVGGHLGPANCDSFGSCDDTPETTGPQTPTWNNIQLEASYENKLMIAATYDVCYCDSDCGNSMSWFKAGVINVYPAKIFFSFKYSNEIALPVVNTAYYITITGAYGPGGWTNSTQKENTRELKILHDIDGLERSMCFVVPQSDAVLGHSSISGDSNMTDHTYPSKLYKSQKNLPLGQQYGGAEGIKIMEAGPYAICYCDQYCDNELNWAIFNRIMIAGPKSNHAWKQYVGLTFDLSVQGHGFANTNRLKILRHQQGAACGADVPLQPDVDVWGPQNAAQILDDSSATIIDMVWHPSGTEASFDRPHLLNNNDVVFIEHVNVAEGGATPKMYNTFHKVSISCDIDIHPLTKDVTYSVGCYKAILPVSFPLRSFPTFQNINQIRWRRSSEETFEKIKVGLAGQYIACWSASNFAYVGDAGYVTVEDPVDMADTFLGLTTVHVNPSTNGAPVVVAFKTGDFDAYSKTNGQMSLMIVVMPKYQNVDAIELRDTQMQPVNDVKSRSDASQAYCGKFIQEMWSEDRAGFPMPEGCFYDEDSTDPLTKLKRIHIVFSPRNNLKRRTRYMIVMNVNVLPINALPNLTMSFPSDGAIHVWSMGDYHSNPYDVIERGKAFLSPLDREPVSALPTEVNDTDILYEPMFDPYDGFKISAADGAALSLVELKYYCSAHDTMAPDNSPGMDMQCRECQSEADCGNRDSTRTWCLPSLHPLCPNEPMALFTVNLKAKEFHPIARQHHLRMFFFPLTEWNLGTDCQQAVNWTSCSDSSGTNTCGELQCITESVVGGDATNGSAYPINVLKVTLGDMHLITHDAPGTIAITGITVPQLGFFPQIVTAEIMDESLVFSDYWGWLAPGGARLYRQPRVSLASLIDYVGDGNNKPFRSDEKNRLFIRLAMGTTLLAHTSGSVNITLRLPESAVRGIGYECLDFVGKRELELPELGVLGGLIPSTKGKVAPSWIGSKSYCKMSFEKHEVLYANSIVFLEIEVNNPTQPLQKDDPTNSYEVTVQSGDVVSAAFTLRNYGRGYARSVSVLGMLTETSIIAPADFRLAPATNLISIFFKTEQATGSPTDAEAEVWVDAPHGFDFGKFCVAVELPMNYHMPEKVPQPQRLPFGDGRPECKGEALGQDAGEYSRARIRARSRLSKETFYGFRVRVANLDPYSASWLSGWRIWTATHHGALVDGSYTQVRFQQLESCLTAGTAGVGAGYMCIFPFIHNGVKYRGCTRAGHARLWCSTEVDGRDRHVYGNWGECAKSCKKSPGTAATEDFPLPLLDDFERYNVDDMARYFADYGGSWQVAVDPTRPGNQVLKQWVDKRPGTNQWVPDMHPISLVGYNIVDASVFVTLYIPRNSAALTPRLGVGPELSTLQSARSGHCMATATSSSWRDAEVLQQTCARGEPEFGGRFKYDSDHGYISLWSVATSSRNKFCITTNMCSRAGLCLLPCGPHQNRGNQSWTWREDGSIRLRSDTSLCITATGVAHGSPLQLLRCEDDGDGKELPEWQQWVAAGNDLSMHAGVCVRLKAPSSGVGGPVRGYCLKLGVDVGGRGKWMLERGGSVSLASGPLMNPLDFWHSVMLEAIGPNLQVVIDNRVVAHVNDGEYGEGGMTAVHSAWGVVYFDDFAIEPRGSHPPDFALLEPTPESDIE